MNVKNAIDLLNENNDDHWTADGLPRVDAVMEIMGAEVTRRQITDASQRLRGESVPPIGTPEDEEQRKPAEEVAPEESLPPAEEPQAEPEKPAEPNESPAEEVPTTTVPKPSPADPSTVALATEL